MEEGASPHGTARVLVVDDTPENLTLLTRLLHGQRYEVQAVTSGELALEAAAAAPLDLILLDVSMPGMDGFEVCSRLKADERFEAVPVIFISALDDTTDKVRAFAVGGVDYVTKPFQFDEVLARTATHLELRRLRRELERHNRELRSLVRLKVKELSAAQMAIIFSLAKLAESRDTETGRHLERVQVFCRLLAESSLPCRRELDDAFIEDLVCASPLHDVGKVGIPDAILLKPGAYTPEEFDVMKGHSLIGARTLEAVLGKCPGNSFVAMGIAVARSHHEKWNGQGYPDGLAGTAIPLCARIMALADVYDALRSKRCYKEAFTHEASRDIILAGRGVHFDPEVVRAFEALEESFRAARDEFPD